MPLSLDTLTHLSTQAPTNFSYRQSLVTRRSMSTARSSTTTELTGSVDSRALYREADMAAWSCCSSSSLPLGDADATEDAEGDLDRIRLAVLIKQHP